MAWLVPLGLLTGALAGTAAVANTPRTDPPRHELLQAAKEPFQRGLVAAQQKDWKLAIRYLTDAENADPDAPEIWFNLGLASSKQPGYELRSMAWFQAYLLVVPDAPNASAVRSQLLATEIAYESRISKILEQLESVAAVIQTSRMAFLGSVPHGIVPELAAAHNFIGDSTGAARLLEKYNVHENDINDHAYVDSVASIGRFGDAMRLDYYEIEVLYEKGNLQEAENALEAHGDQVSEYKWEDLACSAYESGNREILQFATAKAVSKAAQSSYPDSTEEFLISVGKPDEAEKFAAASKSPRNPYLNDKLSGKIPTQACNRKFWWGENRRKYLIDFALNGLVLDTKNKLDDTQLDDLLKQEAPLMAGSASGSGDETQQYVSTSGALEYTSGRIEELTRAYRIIRGPKID